ncbi:MAG TPA: hypothetical protein DCW29_11765 [Janthinobacterium sp.]|nr:hypothetical protein [Janthinobacterium sp.]
MSQTQAFDHSIPVLTEVLQPQVDGAAPAPSADPAERAEQLEALALKQWTEQEWHVLERRLAERILHQLQGRVDFVLEQRIKDSMADVLQHALTALSSELRAGLQHTIEQIVTRAVSQELTHLQTLKK